MLFPLRSRQLTSLQRNLERWSRLLLPLRLSPRNVVLSGAALWTLPETPAGSFLSRLIPLPFFKSAFSGNFLLEREEVRLWAAMLSGGGFAGVL